MKFDLTERVTGADLCPNVAVLSFPRDLFDEVLSVLEQADLIPDAFSVQQNSVTAAVILPEERSDGLPTLPQNVSVEEDCFRLILRGRRLQEHRGLGGSWEAVLAREEIPVFFSCSDAVSITQYLPNRARPAVLALLNSAFSIHVI